MQELTFKYYSFVITKHFHAMSLMTPEKAMLLDCIFVISRITKEALADNPY